MRSAAKLQPCWRPGGCARSARSNQVEYEYDLFDRRIGRRGDPDGDTTFESALRYIYDGRDIVLAFAASGSLTNRYLHGPAVDQILADETAAGDLYWALPDNQGTIRDLAEYDALFDTTTIVKAGGGKAVAIGD